MEPKKIFRENTGKFSDGMSEGISEGILKNNLCRISVGTSEENLGGTPKHMGGSGWLFLHPAAEKETLYLQLYLR